MGSAPPDVIVVTDGDDTAWKAVEDACRALDCHALRASRGNPTPLDGEALVDAVVATGRSPVVVMVDDQGDANTGPGERALTHLLQSRRIRLLGVVAVASHTPHVEGVRPLFSVTADGRRVSGAVDKEGEATGHVLRGDTVDVLAEAAEVGEDAPIIVGLGDPGKMGGRDRPERGEPATRAALAAILQRRRPRHG
jgi:stage V sporulation protein AE